MLLGKNMRGWSVKDHGPVTDAIRTTGEIRLQPTSVPRLTCVLFSDLLAYPRKVAWRDMEGYSNKKKVGVVLRSITAVAGSAAAAFGGSGDLEAAKERLQKALDQKIIAKTSAGVGIRCRVGGVCVKADLAKLNSCHMKLSLGLGDDFSVDKERQNEAALANYEQGV
jgi:hypothetical protein